MRGLDPRIHQKMIHAKKDGLPEFAPSPLAGEGCTEFQQARLGEGVSTFESSEEAPSPN
jgi:hypothetical protein